MISEPIVSKAKEKI